MSKASPPKSNAVAHNSRNNMKNERIGSSRAKSVDSARLRRREKNEMDKLGAEPLTLKHYGYHFADGKLVSITDGRPFEFYVYSNKEDNHKRYHDIGRLVDNYVYEVLENQLELQRIEIPLNPSKSEPTGFFFASHDLIKSDYLMIIIHGSGVVRAGQWSRKLIINENLEVGSQLDYIGRARTNGYAVIVTNTNLNTDETPKTFFHNPHRIRGSGSPEEHACYIWENYVRRSPARHICIMAHSYGGAVVLELAAKYKRDFDERVFAVALTDSPMRAYTTYQSADVLRILQKRTINWIADQNPVDTPVGVRNYGQLRSAGPVPHERTSFTAFRAIFKFFEEQRRKIEASKH